jgi:hypothetical protein
VRTHAQVVAAKPPAAFDLCFLTGDTNFTTPVTDMALCDADAAPAEARVAAPGGRRSARREHPQVPAQAADPSDYAPVRSRPAQLARLNAAFPGGVCDWSKPGVGQQEAISPLTFAAGRVA